MSVRYEQKECRSIKPARYVRTLAEDVLAGLVEPPRKLPPKYFYDERGSLLFDQICDTQEYYPTRVEDALLAEFAQEIIHKIAPDHILELGSGTSRKTRHLFRAYQDRSGVIYWPFDVCREVLVETAEALALEFPQLEVRPLLGDYSAGLEYLPQLSGRSLYVFLGSTLGNFEEEEAVTLLRELSTRMSAQDRLLLGIDRAKPAHVLRAAYDDNMGLTEAFNRNLLSVLNRELKGDFRPSAFSHRAVYNEEMSRIEMYLVAKMQQEVNLETLNLKLEFSEGDSILTEISRKFTLESAARLLGKAGLTPEEHYTPEDQYFSLLLVAPERSAM
ncbi:L-histidine N(alpha)-methyltransferase [Acidihalobacter prosperus]